MKSRRRSSGSRKRRKRNSVSKKPTPTPIAESADANVGVESGSIPNVHVRNAPVRGVRTKDDPLVKTIEVAILERIRDRVLTHNGHVGALSATKRTH